MTTSARIRALNDEFRSTFKGGRVITMPSVHAFGPRFVAKVRKGVREFRDFTAKDDPRGEHAAGVFKLDGRAIGWRIEYDDTSFGLRPLDPSNVERTHRVLIIF